VQYGPPFFLKVGVHFAPPKSKVKDDTPEPCFPSPSFFFLVNAKYDILFPAISEYEKRSSVRILITFNYLEEKLVRRGRKEETEICGDHKEENTCTVYCT
jgi:hypothetical protein